MKWVLGEEDGSLKGKGLELCGYIYTLHKGSMWALQEWGKECVFKLREEFWRPF